MGFLRIYLAIVVLLSHCPQGVVFQKISHPALAVQCFYVISGFYMQLLVNQFKSSGDSKWVGQFYLNRLIRIYPTYLFILLLSMLFLPSALGMAYGKSMSFKALYWVDNLFILPQELMRFLHIPITVLPQSWTLSLEILFYLMAPYILIKRNVTLVLLVIASISCRVMLTSFDLYKDQWLYEFFPSEISLFVAGSLSYRFYNRYLSNARGIFYKAISICIVYYLFWFTFVGWDNINVGHWDGKNTMGVPLKYWDVLLLTIFSLPFLFYLTKNIKLDRYIGEFSYPLYLGHFFFIYLVEKHVDPGYENVFVIALTVLLSLFIMKFIEIPLSKLRERLRNKKDRVVNLPIAQTMYAMGNN